MTQADAITWSGVALVSTTSAMYGVINSFSLGEWGQLGAVAMIGLTLFAIVVRVGPKMNKANNDTHKEIITQVTTSMETFGDRMERCEDRRCEQTQEIVKEIRQGQDRLISVLIKRNEQ